MGSINRDGDSSSQVNSADSIGHLRCDDCPGNPSEFRPAFLAVLGPARQLHWNLPLRLRLGLPPDFGDPVINFRHIGARVQI